MDDIRRMRYHRLETIFSQFLYKVKKHIKTVDEWEDFLNIWKSLEEQKLSAIQTINESKMSWADTAEPELFHMFITLVEWADDFYKDYPRYVDPQMEFDFGDK